MEKSWTLKLWMTKKLNWPSSRLKLVNIHLFSIILGLIMVFLWPPRRWLAGSRAGSPGGWRGTRWSQRGMWWGRRTSSRLFLQDSKELWLVDKLLLKLQNVIIFFLSFLPTIHPTNYPTIHPTNYTTIHLTNYPTSHPTYQPTKYYNTIYSVVLTKCDNFKITI